MINKTTTRLVKEYKQTVETLMAGGLVDAEVDMVVDEQERIVQKIRKANPGVTVRELNHRPWIEVR